MTDAQRDIGQCLTRVPTGYREAVAKLLSRLQVDAAPCLERALDGADDALFARAERGKTDSEQDTYFSAMRALRLQRSAVAERFEAALEQSFRERFGQASTSDPGPGESWSIMEPDELEEEVAIDATVSRLRGHSGAALAEIGRRLGPVVTDGGEADDNPADPGALVHAFASGLQGVGIGIQPRIIVYKLLEKELLDSLDTVYERLNEELAATGLRADDDDSDAGEADSGPGETGYEAANEPQVAPLEEMPPAEQVVGLLHELVAATRLGGSAGSGPGGGATGGAGSPGGTVSDGAGDTVAAANGRTIAGVLSALQRSAGHRRPEPLDPDQLKTLVGRGLARHAGGETRLDRGADQTIDIVSMLFEVILDDARLPGAIKALFARLQIPVLKVALMDQEFLANSSHPARRLFNALARAALGCTPSDPLEKDPVYCNIRAAVEWVVEQFNYNAQVFESAREAFEGWQQTARGEARSTSAAAAGTPWEGRERVQAAREQVEAAIESRLAAESEAPDVVGRLLRQAWFKVMFITAVKRGVGSEGWNSQVDVMDRLLWSMRPKSDPLERQRLLDDMPGLLQEIRDGLNGIMYNPAAMTEFFHELRDAHLRILEQPVAAPRDEASVGRDPAQRLTGAPTGESPASSEAGADTDDSQSSDNTVVSADFGTPAATTALTGTGGAAASTSDVEVVRELRQTAIGTWFEFLASDGGRTRARLASRADNGQRYVFVNRRGEQTATYGLNDLATAVAAGEAAPVDPEALFDRALESVIAQLQRNAG